MAKEMFDYLSNMVADYTTETLSVGCQVDLEFKTKVHQVVHEFDDGTVKRKNISSTVWYEGYLQWPKGLDAADHDTVTDIYSNSSKANFGENTIYWEHPTDGHTYVLQFMGELAHRWAAELPNHIQIPSIPVRIVGRQAEA